jgi:CRP-like cAMP-binding protein
METLHTEPVALYPMSSPTVPEAHSLLENAAACQFLRSLVELRELPTAALRALANNSRFCALHAGQCITREGDEELAFGFIVASGCISMLKTSISGKELMVELLQAGDTFGLLVMLAKDDELCQLTARAIRDSRVLLVPIKSFLTALQAPSIWCTSTICDPRLQENQPLTTNS